MPVIFKAIKPKAFKSKEFTKALERNAEVVRKGIVKDYEAGVSTWSHKPKFRSEVVINPAGGIAIHTDTDDEIYGFVHEGTRPHLIRPRRAKRLKFRSGYRAKTRPGVIQAGSGGASGNTLYRRYARHPGTKGRKFSVPIRKKWEPFFTRQMERAFSEAARKSGHSI